MQHLLKSSHALWIFFLITAAIGWATSQQKMRLLKSLSPVSLALLDAFLTVIALLVYGLVTDGWNGMRRPIKEIGSLALHDSTFLALLALYGAGAGLIGATLLKHHGVVDYRLTGMLISIAAAVVGVWFIVDDGITWKRGVGLGLLGAGAFLAMGD